MAISCTQGTGMVIGCLVMLISGTLYAWNSFEAGLEAELGYNKKELNVISSVANVCNLVAFPAGWVFDKHGPFRVVLVGSLLTVAGWLLLHFLAEGRLPTSYLWFMVFYSVVGHGVIWLYMAALLTSVRNFTGEHRGKVVGLLDACFGASAAVFSAVYGGFFDGKPVSAFFLFGAIVTAISGGVLPLLFLRVEEPIGTKQIEETYVGSTDKGLSTSDYQQFEGQPVSMKGHTQYTVVSLGSQDPTMASYQQHVDVLPEKEGATDATENPEGLDIGGWEFLKHPHFLLMFPVFAVTLGGGTAFLNVISQALRENEKGHLIHSMTLVIPILGTVSRFLAGIVSDYVIHRIPRIMWVVLFVLMFVVSEIIFLALWQSDAMLLVAGALSGCAFGGLWCVSPTLLSEDFGVTHFGFNWGVALVACVIGTVVYGNISPHISSSSFFWSLLIGNLVAFAFLSVLAARAVRQHKRRHAKPIVA